MTYQQWVEGDVNIWIRKGVTKDHLLQMVSEVQMMEGTLETLQKLKNSGLSVVMISGGLNFVVENIFRQHLMLFDHIFINKLVYGEGGKIIGVKATPYDFNYKAEGLRHIAEMEGIFTDECVFVGNGDNDIEAAKTAGLSIAFNPNSPEFTEVCDVLIENDDLREVLKYILE
ncbi:HAD family hydrolase [Bacteroidota bacterium]